MFGGGSMDVGRVVYASETQTLARRKRVFAVLALLAVPLILVSTHTPRMHLSPFRLPPVLVLTLSLYILQTQFSWDLRGPATTESAWDRDDPSHTLDGRPGQTEKVSRKLIDTMQVPEEPRRACKRGGNDLPNLVLVQEWRTKKQRPKESITLMTQLSADR